MRSTHQCLCRGTHQCLRSAGEARRSSVLSERQRGAALIRRSSGTHQCVRSASAQRSSVLVARQCGAALISAFRAPVEHG
eukprot:11186602-Alexandrium_andersonii.AAC.1